VLEKKKGGKPALNKIREMHSGIFTHPPKKIMLEKMREL
jgi:hypothetical protein